MMYSYIICHADNNEKNLSHSTSGADIQNKVSNKGDSFKNGKNVMCSYNGLVWLDPCS